MPEILETKFAFTVALLKTLLAAMGLPRLGCLQNKELGHLKNFSKVSRSLGTAYLSPSQVKKS
jgi:hypothetical protein